MNENDDDQGDSMAEIHTNEIHMRSKGPLSGVMKPVDQTKKYICPVKEPAPKVHVEKSRPGGQSKNTPIANHQEKENASPTIMKDTQDGKIPPKKGKIGMFTMPYPVYKDAPT